MASKFITSELVGAAKCGDSGALLRLIEVAQPDIRRYAQKSCKKADDVEDAVQETLWLLYRRVGTIQTITSFSGWLFAVVRRECMRLARKAMCKHEPLDDHEDNILLATRSDEDLKLDLVAAIQSLPDHYREIILLRDVEELTIAEIANQLHLTAEAVKSRIHRARTLIREYLIA